LIILFCAEHAKAEILCGAPPPISDQTFKADAEAEANFLKKMVGAVAFKAEVENKTTEIFSKYPNGTYQDAYFMYMFCQLLLTDRTMSTRDKLDALTQFHKIVMNVQVLPISPSQPAPRLPPVPPVRVPRPVPLPRAALPPSQVVGPAVHLGGQRWTITIGGQPLSIEFEGAPDYHVMLSSDRYGRQGTWSYTGSVGFRVDTNTHIIYVWFVQNGARITSCGGVVVPNGGGQSYTVADCQRHT
jgi:hypothetical protein